ncbi:YgaC family protein [Microbacterium sp. LRZ72]|uniref:DUF402 domain-containing protein n=1 Tax=Microbacterium sp. LRZ72 TaxID=2942481 RepID=UPI0029B65256|nr:DUF402 domain-containing protein [Microbacterium sp. LRZ72]MDX2377323.1 YgaC family protein [Microbacterium sp. LRZ72]
MSERPEPGTRLMFRWRKWDGGVHWLHECVFLGTDAWGDWVGQRAGWRSERPGRALTAPHDNVTLMAPSGDHALTMNAAGHRTRVYIDLAWDVRWQDGEPTGIDMDLDVIDRAERVFIDDIDEWEEHSVLYGYPRDVMTHLEDAAADLERRVRAHEPPYDRPTAERWLTELARLAPE